MLDVYGRHVKPSTIDDNSPFMCNVRCGNNSGLFGLKGRSCYCLGDGSKLRGLTVENMTHTEIRCPGDYNELCGDDKRISVYAGDMTSISSSGTCGYVRKISDSHVKSQLHLDDDCTKKRFYAYKEQTGETSMGSRLRCRGGVCVSNTTESWTDAVWKTRGLLKVTDANRESLYSAMHYRDYWIGLRRRQEYKWINGNSVARNMSRHYLDKRCLAVRRDDSHVHVAWYPCSDTYRAVCQSIKPDKTDDDRGIYLGVAATIVAVFMLCLIGAVIHFKRKGLCCFKANDETDSAHSANSPSPLHYSRATVPRLPGQTNNVNATDRHKLNILDAGVCDGDAVYSVIDGPECPGCSDPYTDPIRAAGVEDGEYNTTRQAHGRRDDNTYNHIRTGYDREGSDQDGNLYHEVTEA
ncbi:uncharacterized protein LOC124285982 [Haliotis rubra]|uniref:uncharacterized protein LOC124285982 n=1 Tax=Haliotis rubra TaxID=36100 RepID=UPI001EE5CFB3|nr:uncharacterized protein LOC124285982 [Haliotis rubra]